MTTPQTSDDRSRAAWREGRSPAPETPRRRAPKPVNGFRTYSELHAPKCRVCRHPMVALLMETEHPCCGDDAQVLLAEDRLRRLHRGAADHT